MTDDLIEILEDKYDNDKATEEEEGDNEVEEEEAGNILLNEDDLYTNENKDQKVSQENSSNKIMGQIKNTEKLVLSDWLGSLKSLSSTK